MSEDVLMSFCVAGVAVCDLMHDGRSRKIGVFLRKLQKRVFLDVSEDVLMPFCVACVAVCDL